MPKTGENIYKRKDGRWEGRYIKERVNGKAKYGTVYAKNYREVKAKLEEAKRTQTQRPAVMAGKVEDISNCWLYEMSLTLKESSRNKYKDILYRYILPKFGAEELSEISNQSVLA